MIATKWFVKESVDNLKAKVDTLNEELNQDRYFYWDNGYITKCLRTRIAELENTVDLLLSHLDLCKVTVPSTQARNVLKPCEKASK